MVTSVRGFTRWLTSIPARPGSFVSRASLFGFPEPLGTGMLPFLTQGVYIGQELIGVLCTNAHERLGSSM